MRVAVQADDGDEVSISANAISTEQAIVRLTIGSSIYDPEGAREPLALTVEKARALAKALLSVAEAVEFASTPPGSLDWSTDTEIGWPLESE